MLAWKMKPNVQNGIAPIETKLALRCIFYRKGRQRIDCDNLLKAVSDSATGVVWVDDSQVHEVFGKLVVGQESPRVDIVIYEIENMSPHALCLFCKKPFKTYPSTACKYCSRECFSKSTRVDRTCEECNKSFTVRRCMIGSSPCRFCSQECLHIWNGKQKTLKSGPQHWKCKDCGGAVSRREYIRCKYCNLSYRRGNRSNFWSSNRIAA